MSEMFYQSLNPDTPPSPVTPSASPPIRPGVGPVGDSWVGTAPYDISAPQDIPGISAAVEAAGRLTGAGIVYPQGPRQRATNNGILDTPQGADSANVFDGFPDYENEDLRPNADLETPIQGEMGTYPQSSTYQPGITQFTAGLGAGVEGVRPEQGSMGPGGGEYPGTMQDGLQKYGTT